MSLVNHSPFYVLVTPLQMSMHEPGKRQARWPCHLSGDQEIRTAISCKKGSQIAGLVLKAKIAEGASISCLKAMSLAMCPEDCIIH